MMVKKMVLLCKSTQTSLAQKIWPQTEHLITGVEECQARALSTESVFEVYFTLHLSYLGLLLYSGMHLSLSLSLGLCWWSLCSPNPRIIRDLLKFHSSQRLLNICIINVGDLKIFLSAQINPNILEHSSEEAATGEYVGRALTT